MDIDKALNVEELRGRCLKHTRRAYRLLPSLEQPRILDIGCGQGQQTIELVRLSGGEVVGIDIDHTAISRLRQRIDQTSVGDRIKVIHVSLFDNKFDDKSFDVLWRRGFCICWMRPEALRNAEDCSSRMDTLSCTRPSYGSKALERSSQNLASS